MNEILRGIKPLDYVLAGLLTAGGAALMAVNVNASDSEVARQVADGSMAHAVNSHSWAMLPVFVLVTLPILFRRTAILPVIAVTVIATSAHVLAFGWVTRCGIELPLAAALAYAVARFAHAGRDQLLGMVGVGAVVVLCLVKDSSAGMAGLVVGIPAAALFFGIGWIVRNRAAKPAESSTLAPVHAHA